LTYSVLKNRIYSSRQGG